MAVMCVIVSHYSGLLAAMHGLKCGCRSADMQRMRQRASAGYSRSADSHKTAGYISSPPRPSFRRISSFPTLKVKKTLRSVPQSMCCNECSIAISISTAYSNLQ